MGLVFIYRGKFWYGHADIPRSIRRRFKCRKTDIMGYEMIAAVAAIFEVEFIVPEHVCIRHFVDNTSANTCTIQGSSRQDDLNDIVGMLWHTAAHRTAAYWCEWVQSNANKADAPSRNDCALMKQLNGIEIQVDFNQYVSVADSWKSNQEEYRLMRRG